MRFTLNTVLTVQNGTGSAAPSRTAPVFIWTLGEVDTETAARGCVGGVDHHALRDGGGSREGAEAGQTVTQV